jgi:hypothetical protein
MMEFFKHEFKLSAQELPPIFSYVYKLDIVGLI